MNDVGTFYSTSGNKRASIDSCGFYSSPAECGGCLLSYGSTTMQTKRHQESNAFGDVGVHRAADDEDVFSYSSKLSKLSLDERSSCLHDVHGVAEVKAETPEMLQSKLKELNEALASPPGDSRAYKRAVSKSPEYVEHLKIPCLRAKEYNSEQAAGLMIRLFNKKLELFGEEKLAEDIQMTDMTDEENDAIRRGLTVYLKERDRAGRAVLFVSGQLNAAYGTRTVMRILFQGGLSTVLDEETTKSGVVAVYYGIGQKKFMLDRPFEFVKTADAIPVRIVSLHCCSDNPAIRASERFLYRAMDGRSASRYRLHIGTSLECIYKLMTFGIPREAIPVSATDGTVDLTWHHKMLKQMEAIQKKRRQVLTAARTPPSEASTPEPQLEVGPILVPMQLDVMMGRGHHPKNRPGALRMHNLVLEYREEYDSAAKLGKTAITKKILHQMKQSGSRFLIGAPGGGYMECSDTAAREKISAGFRNLRIKEGGKSAGKSKENSRKRRSAA